MIKTTTESIANSTVYRNDPQLTFAVGANETWHVQISILFYEDLDTDIKFRLLRSNPAGDQWLSLFAEAASKSTTPNYDSVGYQFCGYMASFNDEINYDYSANRYTALNLYGAINTGSTAGTITLQWAQRVSGSDAATVYRGSYIKARRLQ